MGPPDLGRDSLLSDCGASAAVAFFRARDMRDWIMYAGVFLFAAMAVAMLKLWYLMELNRNTHTREIKRVELQLARFAEK